MSQVENKVNYHDLTGLAQLKHSSGGDDDAALKQAAKQFESIFMGMLLSSMRKANEVFEDDGVLNSNATKFYQDMYDKQLSTELSEKGSLGLADLLVQQLRPTKGKTTPASMLKLPTEAAPVPDKTASADTSVPAIDPAKNTAEVVQPVVTTAPQVITETLASEPDPDNEDWSFESPGEFIQKLMPAAKQAAQKLGLEPLALLAQAALETGWGQRTFKTADGSNSFNFLALKRTTAGRGMWLWLILWSIVRALRKKKKLNSVLMSLQSKVWVTMSILLSRTRVISRLWRWRITLKPISSNYRLQVMPQTQTTLRKFWLYLTVKRSNRHETCLLINNKE